ncbi:MAG: cytochrome P450 [Chloroflexota bacterium]|nr:MAG: cytochrome P450 [Chloroflexota bacterium]
MNSANTSITGAARQAPSLDGYPLVGILPKLWKNPLKFFLDTAIQYGDVVQMKMGSKEMYLVSRPESVKYILQDNNRNFRKGYDQAKPLMGEGLVTSEGDFWLRQRRIMQPSFHRDQIATFSNIMLQATEAMLERWRWPAQDGQPLDMAVEMMRLTQTIILRTMFSTDIGAQAETIGKAFDITLEHLNQILFSPFELLTRLPTPANLRHKRALRFLDDFVYGLITNRRKSGEDNGDLLSRLILARDQETGEGMTDQQVRDEVMTIFLAGHETTANALAWTWYLLSQHPEVEETIEAEIEVLSGGRPPTFEDISRLEYTNQVFSEALRLYPPAWMFVRHAVEDDVIGGYRVPAGMMLMISPYVTHRLPDVWEQPERFDPDRFSPERSKDRPRFSYYPFSGGPRVCIGNNFATVEALLIMARVVQCYRLRLVPGYRVEARPIATLQPHPGVLMQVTAK